MTDLSTVLPATSARANELRDRHLDFFLLLAERAGEQIRGSQHLQALRVLDEETDNIRAAMGWAQEQGESDAMLRFIVALREYWPIRVPSEGLRWCRAAIEKMDIGDTDLVLRARAFVAAGGIARNALAHVTDRRWIEEGIRLAREVNDDLALARGLYVLGTMMSLDEGAEEAIEATREGLSAARQAKADVEMGDLLRSLGTKTYRLEGGIELVEEASELQRKIGDRIGLGWTLNWLAWNVDSPKESIERARELTTIAEELKDESQLAAAFILIAWTEAMHGDPQRARDATEEAIKRFRTTGSKVMVVWMQSNGGWIRLMQGRAEDALPMFEEVAEIGAAWDEWRMAPRAFGDFATVNQFLGNRETAWKLIDKALDAAERVASPRARADVLAMAGDLALVEGDLDRARSYLEDSLSVSEHHPDSWPQPVMSLALVAELEGDLERAFELAKSHAELNKNSRFGLPGALTALGRVEAKLGRYVQAEGSPILWSP